jgi:hypothetical protein
MSMSMVEIEKALKQLRLSGVRATLVYCVKQIETYRRGREHA